MQDQPRPTPGPEATGSDRPEADQVSGPSPEAGTPKAGSPEAGASPSGSGEATKADAGGDRADADEPLPGAEAGPAGEAAPVVPPVPPRRRFARVRRYLHLPRSRRGIMALVLVFGGFVGVSVVSGVQLINWTETADFCGRCHQMGPELAAYAAGPHAEVACAECHVKPGVIGWIEAKINGTKQLAQVILGLYPEPVPPPDHAALPSTDDTCKRCHSVDRLATTQLRTTAQFAEDEANTRQVIGLMVRPKGGDQFDESRSVHWHVLKDVEYWSADPQTQTIDLVEIKDGGATKTFIAQNQIKVADDVQPDIDRLQSSETDHRMNCIDCHNRVGHPIPDPRTSVDYQLQIGTIDPSLPYIKRESMLILWGSYPDFASADAAADGLREFYQLNYPDVAAKDGAEINAAISEIKILYRLAATPEMKVTAGTYPDDLGHMDFPGCFRCHDGGHYLIQDGKVTNEVIPASCDTCHTFPQIGGQVASLPLGVPPQTHDDSLWVFNHKDIATSTDPGGTSCGECHAKDYCDACHSTGAVNVNHNEMLTNHAAVIRQVGNTACAYCHQPVYCARCHTDQVLPVTGPFWGAEPAAAGSPTPSGSTGPTGLIEAPSPAGPSGTSAPPGTAAPPGIAWPLLSITAAGP